MYKESETQTKLSWQDSRCRCCIHPSKEGWDQKRRKRMEAHWGQYIEHTTTTKRITKARFRQHLHLLNKCHVSHYQTFWDMLEGLTSQALPKLQNSKPSWTFLSFFLFFFFRWEGIVNVACFDCPHLQGKSFELPFCEINLEQMLEQVLMTMVAPCFCTS